MLTSIFMVLFLNQPLKVGIVESKPLVYEEAGSYHGYAVDIIKLLTTDPEFIRSDINTVFDDVKSGKFDIAIGSLSMTAEREAKIDFTHPIYLDGGLTIISKDNNKFGLSKDAWKAVWIFFPYILISSIIFWFVEKGHSLPKNFREAFWSSVWFIDALFSTRGWGDIVPKTKAGKITALIIGMAGIVMYSYFNSFITISSLKTNTYENLEDLKGKMVYTKANTTADKFLKYSGVSYKKDLTIDECYDKLLNNETDVVIFDSPSVLHFAKEHPNIIVGGTVQREAYAFIVNNDELAERLNRAILELRDNGKLDRIKKYWFGM